MSPMGPLALQIRGWLRGLAAGGAAWMVSGCSLIFEFEQCEVDEHCPQADALCVAGTCRDARDTTMLVDANITTDTTWSPEQTYVLDRPIFVEPGASLTIAAGTIIHGRQGSALVVQAGARLFSRGTANEPVVFTSERAPGSRLPGDWGGVALLGRAPVNTADPVLEGVLDDARASYGGDEPEGSCGVLEYTRIEFAGFALQQDEELNGLTLAGCGRGTLVDFVQVHLGLDDGIEVFGGTVNLRHVVITRAQDDSLDWDQGWTGAAQFVAIAQDAAGDNGIEASSHGDDEAASPRSDPQLWNVTLIGSGGEGSQRAMTLKDGTAGDMTNVVVTGHPIEGIDVVGAQTAEQARSGGLALRHAMFFAVGPGGDRWFPRPDDEDDSKAGPGSDDDEGFDEAAHFAAESSLVFGVNPGLDSAFHRDDPGWVPQGLAVLDAGTAPSQRPFDGFDERAAYAGAFAPATRAWTTGWTAYPNE